MPSFDSRFEHRRRLLQWLSASPLLASPGFSIAGVDRPSKLPELEASAPLIASPSEAINVFDFEPVFFKNVPPAHRLHGLGDRRRGDAEGEPRGLLQILSAAAAAERRVQGGHERRRPRR